MGRRRGPSLTRDEVVQAAMTLVRTEGAEALVVSRVASALGIKPPSIYNHVGSSDALARAVVVEATRQLVDALKDTLRGVYEPRERLSALAHGMRAWAQHNGGLYTLMGRIEPDNEDPSLVPILRDLLDLFAQPLGQLGVPESQIIHAIRGLRSCVHGFLLLEAAGQFQLEADPRASFDWMVDTVLSGVTASSHPPVAPG